MKKLFTLLAVMAALALSANAANFKSQSFIVGDVTSLCVSNSICVSNLLSYTVVTNWTGVNWTNAAGNRVITSTTGGVTAYKNLLKDVDLWSASDGSLPAVYYDPGVSGAAATNSCFANIYIKILGTSGANSAVTFAFVPLPDGVNESTVAADTVVVSLTAAGATVVDKTTKIEPWRWPGSGKLRLKYIFNADEDATSKVTVLACSLNGFVP